MKHIEEKLAEREAHNALRSLKQRHFAIDFYSNDYIGFSTNSEITPSANGTSRGYRLAIALG